MSWSDNRRISTDVGWYMPYFTTAEYGWQVREPIHDMLIRIIDNTYDPEYMPDYRAEIHFIADQMMAPDRKIDGKDCRYVSTMKKLLVKSFHTLDLSRAQWEYVAPGGEPYPFDESCDDEIISIWYASDPTIVREQSYKAFMKLAYGDWINYDKKCTLVESPKTVVCTAFTRVTVHGTANGLGTMITGKNYLEQRTNPIPNGAAGSYLSSGNSWEDVITGCTFNTGEATKVLFVFKNTSDSNITPTDVGYVMLVEGSSIPTEYNANTTLYKKNVMQGTYTYNDPSSLHVGNQIIYCGDDGKGGVNNYDMATYVPKRCKTYSIDIESNTTYSLRIFNSSANMTVKIFLLTAPGTITPTFVKPGNTVKTIPGNETFTDSLIRTEQWVDLVASHTNYTSAYSVPIDCRPFTYEYCESFATLKAGTYKLMVDIFGNYTWNYGSYYVIGFYTYRGCSEDNWSGGSISDNEWFALISEDNTFIIPKTDILNSEWSRRKNENLGAPFPNYYHNEFEFTLTNDTKVGLFHRAYYQNREPYFRFMIVDSDVEPIYFETTGVYPADQIGYSAWEKYQMVVSINVKFTNVIANTSTTLTKTVPSLLYSGDFVDFTEDLPTYYTSDDYGIVIVEVLDKDQEDPTIMPTIDINYH